MYERIIVALDGSPLAEQILPHAEALAEKFASTLILLRAIIPAAQVTALVEPSIGGVLLDPELIEETLESEEQAVVGYLNNVATSLRVKGLNVQIEYPQGPAADAIVACAIQRQADLLALTTHGRSGLSKLIFGSVAEGVLKRAPCPTFLVRVRETR